MIHPIQPSCNDPAAEHYDVPGSREARAALIKLLEARGIQNPAVLNALRQVPRHLFVDEDQLDSAYDDTALPIGQDQTISQPFVVGLMSEMLLKGAVRHRCVLEIGTGCGYQTAILSHLFAQVYSIERIKALWLWARKTLDTLAIGNVTLQHGDGTAGWPGRESFDAILVTAAADAVPETLLSLLTPGSCLVAPVGARGYQQLTTLRNQNGTIKTESAEAVRFVPLLAGTRS